eukprot:7966283-Pyramimonas_sp.AAC.1
MDGLRRGTHRVEFLQKVEQRISDDMDEWKQFQRNEQTPNRDWSYLLQVLGEAAAPFFTTPPSPSSEYRQRAAH